jgi:hypothetical protein
MRSIWYRVAMVLAILVTASGWWFALRAPSTVLANLASPASERPKSTQFGTGGAYCTAAVPREWGVYRTGSQQSGLSFEAADGTLRFVTNLPCDGSTPQIALQIRRTSPPVNQ